MENTDEIIDFTASIDDIETAEDLLYQDQTREKTTETLQHDIYKLEHMLDDIQNKAKKMWEVIFVPYIDDYTEAMILTKLDRYEFSKFWEFILDHNKEVKKIIQHINYMYSEISRKEDLEMEMKEKHI